MPPMRRRPWLEGLEEEAEAALRFLVGNPQPLEDARLQRRAVDSHATAADLRPVQHEVVGLCTHAPGSRSSLSTSSRAAR